MKARFRYENSDNMTVSTVFRPLALGNERATIHHTMKDGLPQIYWFSVFHHSFQYADWDIREWWEELSMDEPEGWLMMTDRARLETAANMAATAFENGYDIIKFAREAKKRLNNPPAGGEAPF